MSDNCVVSAGVILDEHCIVNIRGVNLINCDFINLSDAYCLPFKDCLFSSEELLCPFNPKDGVGKINSTLLNISMAPKRLDQPWQKMILALNQYCLSPLGRKELPSLRAFLAHITTTDHFTSPVY